METVNIRTIRRLSNGVVKVVKTGIAARLVSSGNYVYCDGLQEEISRPRSHIKRRLDKTPSPIIEKTREISIVEPPKKLKPPSHHVLTSRKKVNVQANQELSIRSDGVVVEKERSGRKVTKISDIPETMMETIQREGEVSANIIVSPLHSAGNLKELIDEQRSKRGRN